MAAVNNTPTMNGSGAANSGPKRPSSSKSKPLGKKIKHVKREQSAIAKLAEQLVQSEVSSTLESEPDKEYVKKIKKPILARSEPERKHLTKHFPEYVFTEDPYGATDCGIAHWNMPQIVVMVYEQCRKLEANIVPNTVSRYHDISFSVEFKDTIILAGGDATYVLCDVDDHDKPLHSFCGFRYLGAQGSRRSLLQKFSTYKTSEHGLVPDKKFGIFVSSENDSKARVSQLHNFETLCRLKRSLGERHYDAQHAYYASLKWMAKDAGLDWKEDIEDILRIAASAWKKPSIIAKDYNKIDDLFKNRLSARSLYRLVPDQFKEYIDDIIQKGLVNNLVALPTIIIANIQVMIDAKTRAKERIQAMFRKNKADDIDEEEEWLAWPNKHVKLFSIGDTIYTKCYDTMYKKIENDNIDVDINTIAVDPSRCQPKPCYLEMAPRIQTKIDVPGPCLHHAVHSAKSRGCDDIGSFDIVGYQLAVQEYFSTKDWSKIVDCPVITFQEFIDSMTWGASMKARAREVASEIELYSEYYRAGNEAFPKVEIFLDKEEVDPRFIQGKQLAWVLLSGVLIKTYKKRTKLMNGDPHARTAHGHLLNKDQQGVWMHEARSRGHVCGADGSSYDATHKRIQREIFYDELVRIVDDADERSLQAHKDQWRVYGYMCRKLAKYRVIHNTKNFNTPCPMTSGSTATSDENTELRHIDCYYEYKPFGVLGSLCAGDDAVVNTISKPVESVVIARGNAIGRKEKIEIFDEEVVFLQSYYGYAEDKDGALCYVPFCKAGRVLSKIGLVKTSLSKKKRIPSLRGTLISNMMNYQHVPVVSNYMIGLYRHIGEGPVVHAKNLEHQTHFSSAYIKTKESYASMAAYYGVTVDMLISCEDYLDHHDYNTELNHPMFDIFRARDIGDVHSQPVHSSGSIFSTAGLVLGLSIMPFFEEAMKATSPLFWILYIAMLETGSKELEFKDAIISFVYRLTVHTWLSRVEGGTFWKGLHHLIINWFIFLDLHPFSLIATSIMEAVGLPADGDVRFKRIMLSIARFLFSLSDGLFAISSSQRWIPSWRRKSDTLPETGSLPAEAGLFRSIPNCSASQNNRIIGDSLKRDGLSFATVASKYERRKLNHQEDQKEEAETTTADPSGKCRCTPALLGATTLSCQCAMDAGYQIHSVDPPPLSFLAEGLTLTTTLSTSPETSLLSRRFLSMATYNPHPSRLAALQRGERLQLILLSDTQTGLLLLTHGDLCVAVLESHASKLSLLLQDILPYPMYQSTTTQMFTVLHNYPIHKGQRSLRLRPCECPSQSSLRVPLSFLSDALTRIPSLLILSRTQLQSDQTMSVSSTFSCQWMELLEEPLLLSFLWSTFTTGRPWSILTDQLDSSDLTRCQSHTTLLHCLKWPSPLLQHRLQQLPQTINQMVTGLIQLLELSVTSSELSTLLKLSIRRLRYIKSVPRLLPRFPSSCD